ncbi:MAG: SGNH/GDSL hydrolase family protein [Bryobacteraceae bacterium]
MGWRCALLLSSVPLIAQIPFTQFVVFGDSLSDNGNFYAGTTLLGVPQPGPPLYATGKFTDGTNSVPFTTAPLGLWIEQLAAKMNLPAPQPYAKGGMNYAVASAETGKNPGFSPRTLSVPYLTDQLNLFLATHPTPPVNALYVFWGGGNDILAGLDSTTAVSNIQGNINTLATAGAKYFFWANQPPVGEVPENINTSNRSALDAASVTYNNAMTSAIARLKTAHAGITIITGDAYSGFVSMTQNPLEYGFVNVTSPAQGLIGVNPNTYLFWDVLHPTTAGHGFFAITAYAAIESVFATGAVISAVENAADFQVKTVTEPAAPNSLISIYALNLGPVSGSNLFPATGFQGIQVLFDGTPAPLYDVVGAVDLINVAVPSNLPASGAAMVTVQTSTGTSSTFTLPLGPTDVGIFRLLADPAHPNQGAVTIANSAWRVMPASTAAIYGFPSCAGLYPGSTCGQPAAVSSDIVIYLTGGGLATPNGTPGGQPVPSGSVAPADGSVIYETVQTPTVTIGGVSAPVAFSGIAPGSAAEYQINTTIPAGVQSGDSVPVVVTFGSHSDTVTIAIQ